MSSTWFSVGGVLARGWPGGPRPLPWALAASGLLAGSMWDPLLRGGSIDFILLGLAAYELAVGLAQSAPRGQMTETVHRAPFTVFRRLRAVG